MSFQRATNLPQHNLVLLGLYHMLMIFMFGFFAYIAITGDVYAGLKGQTEVTQATSSQTTTNSNPAPTNSRSQPQIAAPVVHAWLESFTIAGVSTRLDLTTDPTKAIVKLWTALPAAGYPKSLHGVTEPNKVYAVYHNYHHQNQHVQLTLGYRVKSGTVQNQGVASTTVASGRYQRQQTHAEDSVLLHWQANSQAQDLLFNTDFEVHTVDAWLQAKQSVIYLGLRGAKQP